MDVSKTYFRTFQNKIDRLTSKSKRNEISNPFMNRPIKDGIMWLGDTISVIKVPVDVDDTVDSLSVPIESRLQEIHDKYVYESIELVDLKNITKISEVFSKFTRYVGWKIYGDKLIMEADPDDFSCTYTVEGDLSTHRMGYKFNSKRIFAILQLFQRIGADSVTVEIAKNNYAMIMSYNDVVAFISPVRDYKLLEWISDGN